MKKMFFMYIFILSIHGMAVHGQPMGDNPLMDMRLVKDVLIDRGDNTGILQMWIEVRTTDGSSRYIEQIQNSFVFNEEFHSQVDSVVFSDWYLDETQYRCFSLYNGADGVFEFMAAHYEGGEWAKICGPDVDTWTKLIKISVYFRFDANKTGKISWFGDTPHFNARAVKVPPPGTETIHNYEMPIEATLSDIKLKVELSSFVAESYDGTVMLDWQTSYELENAGFYIFRSRSKSTPYVKISEKMIRPNSSGRYAYLDNAVEVGETYFYKVGAVDVFGNTSLHGLVEIKVSAPLTYDLSQNFPNPFNPQTSINFKLKEGGMVVLQIYNTNGQLVRQLIRQYMAAGVYTGIWDGRDDDGVQMSSGVYIYKIRVNDFAKTLKMQLMK
ncbi:T9SS type A sorting domain-containing protein [candidate division KSB1 bacterium]|nr:T9SS type A sorting domain-containing protein [candidate division KSB1 bacterium]